MHRVRLGILIALVSVSGWAQTTFVEVTVPMADGVLLAGDLYLPSGDGPWPTILVMTPYGKQVYRPDARGLPFDTPDYAWLMVDWRGYGASGGEPLGSNGEDGSTVALPMGLQECRLHN